MGAATENGTWIVGGGHFGVWANDTIRYTGGLGGGLVKMQYYGLSVLDGRGKNQGVHFETEALFMLQEIQFRLWDSNFFAGLGIRYLIASKLGLQMGLDIAKGPDDTAFYIQFGSAWAAK